jgi:acyl carrier protein
MIAVIDRVKRVVVEQLGVDELKVTENANFIDDLGADSLGRADLVMMFEDEFGCEIPDHAFEKICTVKDAVSFIEARRVADPKTRLGLQSIER